jgi:hypothetical protein
MGRIVDVIVDRAGLVRAAVIDFGGFLGDGSRKIVVDWNALHFGRVANKSDSITLELTKDQVTAAPEYIAPRSAAFVHVRLRRSIGLRLVGNSRPGIR